MQGFARSAMMALFCAFSSAVGLGLTLFSQMLATPSDANQGTIASHSGVNGAGPSGQQQPIAPQPLPPEHLQGAQLQPALQQFTPPSSYQPQPYSQPAGPNYPSYSQPYVQHPPHPAYPTPQYPQSYPPQYQPVQPQPQYQPAPLQPAQVIYVDPNTGRPFAPPQIQQAQYVPVTAMGSAVVGLAPGQPKLTKIEGSELQYDDKLSKNQTVFVPVNEQLMFEFTPDVTTLSLNGAQTLVPSGHWTMTIPSSGSYQMAVSPTIENPPSRLIAFEADKNSIEILGFAPSPGSPLKVKQDNSAFTAPSELNFNVYGDSSFKLRLQYPSGHNPKWSFPVFKDADFNGKKQFLGFATSRTRRLDGDHLVELELTPPQGLGVLNYHILPIAVDDSKSFYKAGLELTINHRANATFAQVANSELAVRNADDTADVKKSGLKHFTSQDAITMKVVVPDRIPDDAWMKIVSANANPQVSDRERLKSVSSAGGKTRSVTELKYTFPKGESSFEVSLLQGDTTLKRFPVVTVRRLSKGPSVQSVNASGFSQGTEDGRIVIQFDNTHPLDPDLAGKEQSYSLTHKDGATTVGTIEDAVYDADSNSVTLITKGAFRPGQHVLRIYRHPRTTDENEAAISPSTGIKDIAGNVLATDESYVERTLIRFGDDGVPSEQRGISGRTAPYTPYTEYGPPRDNPQGFNPADKVVTRVARLYYFKDAHRVAQILNRKATSYNRQGVDILQQRADAAAGEFNQAVSDRKRHERDAIDKAQQARAAETKLEQLEQQLSGANSALQKQTDSFTTLESQQSATDDEISRIQGQLARLDSTNPVQQDQANTLNDQLKVEQNKKEDIGRQMTNARSKLSAAQAAVDNLQSQVNVQITNVTTLRESETQSRNSWVEAEEKEDLAARESFQRTVRAKTADPDTHAIGVPDSDDPIEQVSISVIGEGLIHLKGPAKGVNMLRTMINQIDAPVGQVNVALHTIQINGERGDRMEKVAARMEQYLDHARYLTTRSAQMLRNAVVMVASERAMAATGGMIAMDEKTRELKYQEAFFGGEFIQELKDMDSEFLKSGNKILSLHSMDTTSLNSAMFLMALAKNDVREEILSRFLHQVHCQLPADELLQFEQSGVDYKFGCQKFQFLAHNSHFTSLTGFFDAHVEGPDTLNPLQREFIRLAQIYKARLINEMELKQRVVERALIEEKIGNYQAELEKAKRKEDSALQLLDQAKKDRSENIKDLSRMFVTAFREIIEITDASSIVQPTTSTVQYLVISSNKAKQLQSIPLESVITLPPGVTRILDRKFVAEFKIATNAFAPSSIQGSVLKEFKLSVSPVDTAFTNQQSEIEQRFLAAMKARFDDDLRTYEKLLDEASKYNFTGGHRVTLEKEQIYLARLKEFKKLNEDNYSQSAWSWGVLSIGLKNVQGLLAARDQVIDHYLAEFTSLLLELSNSFEGTQMGTEATLKQLQDAYSEYQSLKTEAIAAILDESLKNQLHGSLAPVDQGFLTLIGAEIAVNIEISNFQSARRPLDHKKFLDLLVDDAEERNIELIEGTRAHIANIDNYLKRLSTALEDDFDSQFYEPAFREVRNTSRFWDVQFSQIETTSILANNREFAMVSPKASMEFDLPKRKILINEAFESALAAYNDYGALVGDPNFLALAKMYGGTPAGSTYGGEMPAPLMQDLYPGLPGSRDASFTSQPGGATPRVGANLEALIPDPAIYKFETGTGFEIRPVIHPDGQAVQFHLNYMYTTDIREPVRADEKHLGRIKRHFIDTDVQSENYELRKVSRYTVALKAARTARGVPLLEDIPVAGWLFRPLPQAESSLQQNLIMSQTVIYPTVFDLMGLRWAPAVVDVNDHSLRIREYGIHGRQRFIENEVFDISSEKVDDALRIPPAERRPDLYRPQIGIPETHPHGYEGPGLNIQKGYLREEPQLPLVPPPGEYELAPQGALERVTPPFAELEQPDFESGDSLESSVFETDPSREQSYAVPAGYHESHEVEVEGEDRPGVMSRFFELVKPRKLKIEPGRSLVQPILQNSKPERSRRSRLADLFRLKK